MDLHDPRVLEVCNRICMFDYYEWFIEIHGSVFKFRDPYLGLYIQHGYGITSIIKCGMKSILHS